MQIHTKYILYVSFLILVGQAGCKPSAPPASSRAFTTLDLLVGLSFLPNNWEVSTLPYNEIPQHIGLRNNLGGSEVEFSSEKSSGTQIVAVFSSDLDAARAYQDHDYTYDTQGKQAEIWSEFQGWEYKSPMADQYRVVCVTTKNLPDFEKICIIEAQYEEFLSIFIYRTEDENQVIPELEILAKAIDSQFEKYIKK